VNQSPQVHAEGQYFHAQTNHPQAMPQMQQASLPLNQMFRKYSDTYVQQKPMPSQFFIEYVNPWQSSGIQNPGIFSQYPRHQSMQSQAFMSPVQGNIGESPQIQFFNYLEG
jgi:hypothetical protein